MFWVGIFIDKTEREKMPTYEYECKKCNKRFESFHGMDESVDDCVFCGGSVRRVFHPVGIVFKGPGFYANDSRVGSDSNKCESTGVKSSGKKKDTTEVKKEKSEASDK